MPYYPKSRIIEDQKANSGQFTTTDGKPYSGPYYKTFDGKSFTGKNPYDGISRPLIPITQPKDLNPLLSYDQNSVTYRKLNSINTTLIDPTPFTPIPTEEDYQAGKITRYLARQRNGTQFKIMEISKQTFDDMQNRRNGANFALWKTISIFWQISGPLRDERVDNIKTRAGIIDTNQRILYTAEKNFIGIKQYLSDLKQFSR
jgi:hypothetical protein